MGQSHLGDLSMTLIQQAENECAAHDPDLLASAAMVLVGDVYALLVCHPATPMPAPISVPHEHDAGVSPFIR